MNSILQAERLFYQARRFENQGKTQEALQLYGEVLASPLSEDDPLRASAQKRQTLLQGGGDFGDRFELHLKNFFHETTKPSTLLPVLAGSAVFQISRFALLSRLAQAPAATFTRGLGARALGFTFPFGAELSAFVLAGHGKDAGGREWATSAISLGLLKLSGALAQNAGRSLPRRPWIAPTLGATSLVGGLFAAGRIEQRLGWREKTDVATGLFEAASAAASLSLGTKLAYHLLGPAYASRLGELELRLQENRTRLPVMALAMAGGGKLPPLWMMSNGDGQGGGGKPIATAADLLNKVKRMGETRPGTVPYLLIDFQTHLHLLKPAELNHFLLSLDRLLGVAQPKERQAMLPAWWATLKVCGPAELTERLNQYLFWIKQLPADEIPVLARSLLERNERESIGAAALGKMAALGLKRTLLESRRSLDDPAWAAQLFERMGESSRDSLLKTMRQQFVSEEIGRGRIALEMLNVLAPQLGHSRLIAWVRDLLRQISTANPLVQGPMWRSVQVMIEHIPQAERRKILPPLRKAMTADHGPHPSPFLFVTLGKAIDSLDPASSNLLARELLVQMTETGPAMVKGLLVCFHERLERFSPQNRELLIKQLETLFDAAEPALRSALLVETSHFRDLWKKLDTIEQATLLHRWEKGLAAGEPETVLRQAENLLFTSPAFDIDRKIELFLRLDDKAGAADTPQNLRRALARKLQKMGEELLPEEKAQLITSSRSRRPSQMPFPMVGYLLKGLSHPEAPALAAALSLNASDWPLPLPKNFEYPREFAEWQEKVFEVLQRDKETPRIQPVDLDLGEILPIHHIHRYRGDGNFLKTVEEMRERIFRSLILDGWRPGQMPNPENLREAMTSTDLHHNNRPPLIGTTAASGFSLLVDGHHRLSSLITLVADGHLPPEVLRRLPFDRVYDHSSQGILDEALDRSQLPSYGWKDVLAFHSPSVKLIESLGYQSTLARAFR